MKTARRIFLGSVVSLLVVAIASDASASGKGLLLFVSLLLGWVEWRVWKAT